MDREPVQGVLTPGLFLWVIALVVQIPQVAAQPARITAFDVSGAALWLIGFAFESITDWQLQRFKADPRNASRAMDRGLWR